MWVSIVCTCIVTYVFIRMAFSYTQKRAHQRYAENKQKAPSIKCFRNLSKLLFLFSMLSTLSAYWFTWPETLTFHQSTKFQIIGALCVLAGYVGLNHAFTQLAENYSPLFDAYKPFEITQSGIYALIRHPIYAFNLCVSFGLAISSGLYLVLLAAFIGFCFVMNAVFIEEAYLQSEFEHYQDYAERTWRFVPYIF